MLAKKTGKKLRTSVQDYVVFDLETTGISWQTDEVVEISAVKVIGQEIADEFSALVNPGKPIPYDASAINGITDDMVANSPFFKETLADFMEFARDYVLVGHNIEKFDLRFLHRDACKFWGKVIGNDFIDTLEVGRVYLPELRHHTLIDLAKHYGIPADGAHRALNDCRMNQKVFERLKEEMAHPSEAAKTVRSCPRCGNVLKKRKGKHGDFWGCKSYPNCKYTENIR